MRQTRCKERNKFWKNPFLHAYHINEVERVRIINYIFILIWVYRKHIVHACNFSINPKWSELSTAHLDHNLHFCFSSLSLSHFQYCAPIIACYIRGSSKTGNSQKIECVHIYAYLLWMSCVHSTYGIFPIINIIYFISWKWFDNATIKEMHLYCWTNAQRIKWKEWRKKPKWLRKNVTKALR